VTFRYVQLTAVKSRHSLTATAACLSMFVMFATVELRPCCFGYFAVARGGQGAVAGRTGTATVALGRRGQRPVLARLVLDRPVQVKRVPAKLDGPEATARRRHQRPLAGHQTG
jgi:hypothetical protein